MLKSKGYATACIGKWHLGYGDKRRKFKDMDLIGIPIRITVGRGASEGIVEIKNRDSTDIVEVNRSNFILWNSEIETTQIDKVGSEIDVLPTLLNLFGIEYDSRLIVGKDILSDTPGLAIFSNRSWVSDYGTYNSGKFTLKDGVTLENETEYIKEMNTLVSNYFTLSSNIIKYNMYKYLLE